MSDLSHDRVRAYLQLDRVSLTRDQQAAVDEHLHDCADCRAYADHLARLQAALTRTMHQQWDTEPVPEFAPTATPGPALTATPYEPPVVMPITDREVAIQLALQADRNLVQRDRPITAITAHSTAAP